MEKTCEFCTAWRPIVYCKADAARLCLSCDAKVHSANTLSGRHPRSILCDMCRHNPAHLRCLDHRMLVCRKCDRSLHGFSGQHQKRALRSFTGCPSAQDFASLWNWDLNALCNSDFEHHYVSTSVESSAACDVDRANFISSLESKVESSSQCDKRFSGSQQQQQKNRSILQQIVELRRIQLIEGINPSPLLRGEGPTEIPSQKLDGNLERRSQHSHYMATDLQRRESPTHDLKAEALPLSLSHMEQLPLSSTVGNPLNGETFWQYKNPAQSSQFWSQNMQDLGVCEEIVWHDEFNIPDIDVSFQNFEELFGGDQDPARALLDDKDTSFSSMELEMSLDKSDNGYSMAMEDAANASSNCTRQSTHSDMNNNFPGRMDSPRPLRPSYSTMSISCSRFSTESSGTDCLDSGISQNITGGEPSCDSPNLEDAHLKAKESAVTRHKEKKARLHEKHTRYTSRKGTIDVKKQDKGCLVKGEGYESDTLEVARSY